MSRIFRFKAEEYAGSFARDSYVHIPSGLDEQYLARLVRHVDESFDKKHLKEFARGDKQQALFDFFEPSDYEELREVVATVCGVEASDLTLSERHFKEYEADADPSPLAHKDRFGSEFAVGFSIRVPEGSTLVMYPEHDISPNPFNSTAELRASFSPSSLPEMHLKEAERVEIHDHAGDVQIFRGSATWHLREHGAGTTVLYLKLNTYNCDTLGEDPNTAEVRRRTLDLLSAQPSAWVGSIPVTGRRVDYIHRRYDRDWNELFGVVLYGQPHATISEVEYEALRQMDGQRNVMEISRLVRLGGSAVDVRDAIRRLAHRGFVDLLAEPIGMGQSRVASLPQMA